MKLASKEIDDLKAPGKDGLNVVFFKKAWSVIGEKTIQVVLHFFNSGIMYPPVNCTAITLISKRRNPIKLSEYRPISCCSTVYKIISKVLTKRLK